MKTVLATAAILIGMAGALCSCGGDTIPVDAAADVVDAGAEACMPAPAILCDGGDQ